MPPPKRKDARSPSRPAPRSSDPRFPGLLALLFALVLLSCDGDDPARPDPPLSPIRLLFLGNSLTGFNALPALVDSLAAASHLPITSQAIVAGGSALVDHWNVPTTRQAVEAGGHEVVILQQGPSSLPENRELLREGTRLWNPVIRAAGGRPGLYAVWPDRSRLAFFPDVSLSYRLAAEDVDGLFFPVGDTWLETWALDPAAPLYGPDDFHPSVSGSYAAAVVIVSVLSGRDAESLARNFNLPPGIGDPVDPGVAARIRKAAATVIARNREAAGRRKR